MCPRSIVYCFKIKVKRYFNLKLFVCLFIFGIICFRFNVLLCVYSIFLSLHVIHCTNSRIVEVLLLFHQQRWVWRKKGKANIGKYYWWKPNKVSAWIKCVCSSACVCVCDCHWFENPRVVNWDDKQFLNVTFIHQITHSSSYIRSNIISKPNLFQRMFPNRRQQNRKFDTHLVHLTNSDFTREWMQKRVLFVFIFRKNARIWFDCFRF